MARIVLAHGILGFGSVLPAQPVNYFNGIRALYGREGHEVLCPSVAPLGSLDVRARELESQLAAHWPDDGEPIFLLAHSMGGLDCRRVLARSPAMARRVRRLIAIATPHYGSPVADAVLNAGPLGFLPPVQWLTRLLADDAGALNDLRVRTTLQDPTIGGVDYLCVGCDAAQSNPSSPVFAATSAIGHFGPNRNDGVVSLASASNANNTASLLDIWPVDHGGAVGWPSGGLGDQVNQAANAPPQEHLLRYQELLERLVA
jgi:pimeloyl-ACP methyl ester carboxylesterase